MGASPDGIIKCDCCGIEVKCPFSCTDKTFLEATSESGFIPENCFGKFSLKRDRVLLSNAGTNEILFGSIIMVILLFGDK